MVDDIKGRSPFRIQLMHAPVRGIAHARNAALNAALAAGAAWIAFIDDDETAEPDWLAALMAPVYRSVPILAGRQEMVMPEPRPFWAIPRRRPMKLREGQPLPCAYGNNVRFSMALQKHGLRFDATLGLMGGEDQQFFAAAKDAGFEIRWTGQAITHETMHRERLTYRAQIYRAYWYAASDMRTHRHSKSWIWVFARKLHTIPANVGFGAVELLLSPLFLLKGLEGFKRRALGGGKKIAKGAGRLMAMIGVLPQPYKHIVGN